jgi:hypothetical protein
LLFLKKKSGLSGAAVIAASITTLYISSYLSGVLLRFDTSGPRC